MQRRRDSDIIIDGERIRSVNLSIVPRETIDEIQGTTDWKSRLKEAERKGGIRYAVRALSKQSLHSQQLKKRLLERDVDPDVVEEIVEYCRDQGWIDDDAWVEGRIRHWQQQVKSSIDIKQRFRALGIAPPSLDDRAALEKLIQKKYSGLLGGSIPYLSKHKMIQALIRRGFSYSLIQEVLSKNSDTCMMQ